MSAPPGVAMFPESDRRQADYDAFAAKAECLGRWPRVDFFPSNGAGMSKAKKICRACPVRQECLDYALKYEERYGLWGGFTESERKVIRRQQREYARRNK